MEKIIATLRLMRPANINTALADIFAGFAAAIAVIGQNSTSVTLINAADLVWLLISTAGLYAGGIVFNDVFDAKLDRKERPERPIPKGIISQKYAIFLGMTLFLIGIIAASRVSIISGAIATIICVLCFFYNAVTKHHLWLGPINMGLCRSGNLLLGISVSSVALVALWPLMFIPLTFVSAITLVSKEETQGGDIQFNFAIGKEPAASSRVLVNKLLKVAMILYGITLLELLLLTFIESFHLLWALPFLFLFAYIIIVSLFRAIKNPTADLIKQAVRSGVLAIIVLDAILVAGFVSAWYGALLLLLLPISFGLAKIFAVT